MSESKTIRVVMAGCGTVGCGVGDLLIRDHDILRARTGLDIRLVRAVVRDAGRSRLPHVPDELLTDDPSALDGDDVDVVVEVIGGTGVAKDVVFAAIAAGKDVVTANKALLALHGPELYAAARSAGVSVGFEASCCAGLPVVGLIQRGLAANRTESIEGIFNGTCNYILTEMLEAGKPFADALAEAQRLGYAEADPTLDIDGTDTAHKLAILASLAFGVHVDFSSIPVQGIEQIGLADLRAGRELGLACKLLAVGRRLDTGPALYVRPMFLPPRHPCAGVDGSGNAVALYGHAAGQVMISGLGAGGASTASAIVADLVEVGLGSARRSFRQLPVFDPENIQPVPVSHATSELPFYVRLTVRDREVAAPEIRETLLRSGLPVRKVQPLEGEASLAEDGEHVVALTGPVLENALSEIIDDLVRRIAVTETPVCIPIARPLRR